MDHICNKGKKYKKVAQESILITWGTVKSSVIPLIVFWDQNEVNLDNTRYLTHWVCAVKDHGPSIKLVRETFFICSAMKSNFTKSAMHLKM